MCPSVPLGRKGQSMKIKKTPQCKRGTYKLFDDNGNFVTEYKPGVDGVTEVDILSLHKMDDHEVYINAKENKLPEWYQPIYDKWREQFIADFKEQFGREPFADEIPGRHRVLESLDGQTDPDGDDIGDSSRLEEQLSVSDEEEVPDTIVRLRELVAAMPEQWQKVYRLVFMEGLSKVKAGKEIGISDVRVGQLVKKINAAIAEDETLKNLYR